MKLVQQNPQATTQFSEYKGGWKQLRLDLEILRIRVHQQLKHIQQPWSLSEKALCQYFNNYEQLPESLINPQALFKLKGVRLVRSENKIYFGQITGKVKHGLGIALSRQGKVYQGEFNYNEKHGYGCEVYANGNFYFGNFQQNKKHGKGTFYWFNLSKPIYEKYQDICIQHFIGEWWGGLPDGEGIHQKSNGDLYRGKFKNGLKHGKGKEVFRNGDIYQGLYTNGLPEGYGQYFWKQGSRYKGDFKQGFKDGYGIWTKGDNSEEIYKGHYLLDKRQGYGVYHWGNDCTYRGNFINDFRNGMGELFSQGKLIYKGLWDNGETASNPKDLQTIKYNLSKSNLVPIDAKTLKRPINNSANANRNRSFVVHRQFSAARTRKSKSKEHQFIGRQNPEEHTVEQTCQDHHHRCGHRNCIPHYEFGKMPKQTWQNPRSNWQGPLSPGRNQRRRY